MPDVTPVPGLTTQIAVRATDLTLTSSSTTLQNVTGLGLAIGASATEIWLARWWLLISAANITMDIKYGFATMPSSATIQWGALSGVPQTFQSWQPATGGSTPVAIAAASDTLAAGTGAATTFASSFVATVFGGGTAGTVQLQAAQNTSDAGALKILKGSILEATRVQA
jgi:hypothetical protein